MVGGRGTGTDHNSDMSQGVKGYLGNGPRKQHPEIQGNQNGKERTPGRLISCGAALGTPAALGTILLEPLNNWVDCVCSAQSSLGTGSCCVAVHNFLLLAEAAPGLVTGRHL